MLHNPFRDWLSSIRLHLDRNQQIAGREWNEVISSDLVKIHHHVDSKSSAVVTMRRRETVGVVSNAVNPFHHAWELVDHGFRTINGHLLAPGVATGQSGLRDSPSRHAAFESAWARTLARLRDS